MKALDRIHNTFALAAVIGLAAPALAALDVERSVTVTDDSGGTLIMITDGTRDAIGSQSTTTATFTEFQPHDQGRRINGEVVRERTRTAEQLETVYNGSLEILLPASVQEVAQVNTLAFEDLRVVRDGFQPQLSGTIVYNGEAHDAADLPRPLQRVLAHSLRFFRFA